VAAVLAAGDFDGGDAGVAGEVVLIREAVDAAGVGQDAGGQDRSDAADVGQGAAVFEQGTVEAPLDVGELAVQLSNVT
jgi:hypothetical protein